jgi:hypothetical protein
MMQVHMDRKKESLWQKSGDVGSEKSGTMLEKTQYPPETGTS